ncbi:protein of unknown function (plasmid) [Cupriavidus taiwanensis]|uniref:Uncharacterized protein n=1 Tax=Cupriavidus taiwanensis TaxID=164546 RepID=A0A375IRD9_9BURK|nr:protein of unknown function [Cupriavidus taiwanensis]
MTEERGETGVVHHSAPSDVDPVMLVAEVMNDEVCPGWQLRAGRESGQ